MSNFKKFALGLALAPAAVFAEGTGGTSAVSDAVTQLQSAAEGAVSAVLPAIVAVVVALFGIAAVMFAYRKIKAAIGR